MKFNVEFTTRALKDLKSFQAETQKKIVTESLILEDEPFQFKAKIKRIKGIKYPCFRLRIDHGNDSFRLFYGIDGNNIFILRIIAKKDAEKIIKRIRKIDFPPDI